MMHISNMSNRKILCLGNNSQDTDNQTSLLACDHSVANHGLINDPNFVPLVEGFYHTTVIDLQPGEIAKICNHFDSIVLLDQQADTWSHPVLFTATVKLIRELEQLGHNIIQLNQEVTKTIGFFQNLLETNKSFCIYPFMHLLSRGQRKTNLCSRSWMPVADLDTLGDWQTNKEYQIIRKKMLAGEKIPQCVYCYDLEANGDRGARYQETIEWTSKLKLKNLDDLKTIEHPVYVEIRPSNKCNLACRMCVPRDSHLLDKEWKTLGIKEKFSDYAPLYPVGDQVGFDFVNLDQLQRLYVAGGEPTIMPELYKFLRECIDRGKTDFQFMINTNAFKISDRLLDLFGHFPNLGFSVSLDGVGLVNDYIRWPSRFDEVVQNTLKLQQRGHRVSFISVVGIHNIASLHTLLEYQDRVFPGCAVQLQHNDFVGGLQSPYHHPNTELVLESLTACKNTNVYFNYARGTKSIIDTLYNHYNSNPVPNIPILIKFFEFNDLLDQSRNQKLVDYIPDLEHAREYTTKYLTT